MEHIYKHLEPYSAEKELRYHKHLLLFEEIRKKEESERVLINEELQGMRRQRDDLAAQVEREKDKLIQKERSIGTGLTSTRSGKLISARLVESHILRQERKIKELREIRLSFITIRNQVTANEEKLRALEQLGESVHLIDYKHIKEKNLSLANKIEGRVEELQSLENKCKSALQIMAHMREKSHATEEKMDELNDLLDYKRSEVNTVSYFHPPLLFTFFD